MQMLLGCGEVMEFKTHQGILVRKEDDVFIIWTMALNHIYVRAENFKNFEEFYFGERVTVDVRTQERMLLPYMYEGVNCRHPLDIESQEGDLQTGERFESCKDFDGKDSIMWQGYFQLTSEHPDGDGIITSLRDLDGGLIVQAYVPEEEKELLMENGFEHFEGTAVLKYSASQHDPCPWQFVAIEEILDLNPLVPKFEIYGVCLYLDDQQCYYFYCSKNDGDDRYFGYRLKLSKKLDLKVGKWHRLWYKGKYDLANFCELVAPSICFTVVESSPPPKEKMIYRFFPYTEESENGMISIITTCYIQVEPEPKLCSDYIYDLLDDDNIMHGIFVSELPNLTNLTKEHYIVEVTLLPTGFVVTKCFGPDTGEHLGVHLHRSEYPIQIDGLVDYTFKSFQNWYSQNQLQNQSSEEFVSSAIPEAKETSQILQNTLVQTEEDETTDQSLARKNIRNDGDATGTELSAAEKSKDIKRSELLNSEVTKNVLRSINLNQVRAVVEKEGISGTLEDMFGCLRVDK